MGKHLNGRGNVKSSLSRRGAARAPKSERIFAPGPAPLKRNVHLFVAAISLVALVCLVYRNSLRNEFVWDDGQQIVMNPDLRPGTPWGRLFSSDVWGFSHRGDPATTNYYRPLQMGTYRVAIAVGGLSPITFHALSLLFAAASVASALVLFWELSRRVDVAVIAGALFAVHPIHTEAVDWASALPDVACTVFLLASFISFLVLRRQTLVENPGASPSVAHLLLWTLSVACFAAALLWKETAVVLPLLVAAYVLLIARENSPMFDSVGAAFKASLPFWLVLAGYLLLRLRVLGFIATTQRKWALTPLGIGLTIPHLLLTYWWKLLAPIHLNAYHVFSPVTSPLDLRGISGIVFLVLSCLFVLYAARRMPLLSFGAVWVFITLFPVMNIYAVGRNVMAERYLYLPSVGFCLFIAVLALEVLKWLPPKFEKWPMMSLAGVLGLLFAIQTAARNPVWKNNATLFGQTLQDSPNAPFVQNMVAANEADYASKSQSAEGHYWEAASLASAERPPDLLQMVIAYEGLAWIYSDRSDFERARDLLDRVRKIDPADPEVDGAEGLILTRAGHFDEAATYLQKAVAEKHENENVLYALGMLSEKHVHQLDQAADYFLRALAIHTARDGFRASVHNNLGVVYGEQYRYSDAIEQFKSATAIVPDDPEYHTNLATAFAAAGRYEEAQSEVEAAIEIAPDYEPARALLRQLKTR